MQENDAQKVAQNLRQQLKVLENVGNGAFKKMAEGDYKKSQAFQVDFNKAMKAAQNGNTEELNNLSKRYADTN